MLEPTSFENRIPSIVLGSYPNVGQLLANFNNGSHAHYYFKFQTLASRMQALTIEGIRFLNRSGIGPLLVTMRFSRDIGCVILGFYSFCYLLSAPDIMTVLPTLDVLQSSEELQKHELSSNDNFLFLMKAFYESIVVR